jgi:Zn-dependent peptidase ImmA (M78 family)
MKTIQRSAKAIYKKLNKVVTLESVIKYLNSEGYSVLFYSSPEGKALIDTYKLTEQMKRLNALTYFNDTIKVIFVDDTIPKSDMLCTLLHETAHITLGHLKQNISTKDKRYNEMQAETLAYAVLNYK